MSTYRIAEVAERTGYSPPTLRYYEEIGLLPTPPRSDNGYRVYDEATVARLGFITRAKQLGCSLEEIADLARAWDTGHCAHVQQRLQAVVNERIADTQARIAQLTSLAADLHRAAATLGSHTPDGPCDDRCGCTTTAKAGTSPEPVASTAKPVAVDGDHPRARVTERESWEGAPIACALGPEDMAGRVEDWRTVLSRDVVARTPLDDGLRLELRAEADVGEMARLAAAEQSCCRFFRFALVVDQRGIALQVHAPPDGQEVLTALFGTAA